MAYLGLKFQFETATCEGRCSNDAKLTVEVAPKPVTLNMAVSNRIPGNPHAHYRRYRTPAAHLTFVKSPCTLGRHEGLCTGSTSNRKRCRDNLRWAGLGGLGFRVTLNPNPTLFPQA